MHIKKVISLVLATALVATLSVGCGSSKTDPDSSSSVSSDTSTATSAPVPEKLDPVTIKILQPGSEPAAFKESMAVLEQKMADTVNVKVEGIYAEWSELAQKSQVMLAAGEDVDLYYDAPWLHIGQMISAGYYEDIGELLQKYGQNILKTRPESMWNANKFDGKIMGVPLGIYMQQPHSWMIRKDLREELGFQPLKNKDDLIKFAYAVKEKYPKMYPLAPDGTFGNRAYNFVPFILLDDYSNSVRTTSALSNSIMLYEKNNDGKIYNLFETMEPNVIETMKLARKLYQDKIFNPDIMTINDFQGELIRKGVSAATPQRAFIPAELDQNYAKQLAQIGGSTEAAVFFDPTPGKTYCTFIMDNFICLSKVSKNKERAIMFLDFLNASQENYDIIDHGVVGWEPVGEKSFKTTAENKGSALPPFSIIWNPTFNRLDAAISDDTVKLLDSLRKQETFSEDALAGFMFNGEPVKNEITQYNTIEAKYYPLIMNGVIDPIEGMNKFKAEAGELLKKIQEEEQKQADAFIASKK